MKPAQAPDLPGARRWCWPSPPPAGGGGNCRRRRRAEAGHAATAAHQRAAGAAPLPVVGNFPLTGMPATDAAKLRRPAVAVKIDNNAQARPQAGLEAADVIYEEFTEGITRFVVVFQSADAAAGRARAVGAARRPQHRQAVRRAAGRSPAARRRCSAVVRPPASRRSTENDRAP